ncbi:MAG TPA: hypothetical protein VET85_11795 [Stellaceae bacterium]|nr:hypothetical protein [Stellaceae bacterium]
MPLNAAAVAPARRCHDLLALAAFEVHAGFVGTAQTYVQGVRRCWETGCCAAPNICNRRGEAVADRTSNVIAFSPDAARPGDRPAAPTATSASPTAIATPERRSDLAGNHIERQALSIATLRARGGRLARLLDYWQQLHITGGGLLGNLDAVQLSQMEMLGWLHLVDIGDPDPGKCWLPIWGWRVPFPYPYESANGLRFDEFPIRLLADTVTEDYAEVRARGTPKYQHFRWRLSGSNYNYRRLILPMSAGGKATDRLLVAVDFSAG